MKVLIIIALAAYSVSFLSANATNPFEHAGKMAKLRDNICSANSLQKFARKINTYCAVQQQKMAKFFVKSANLTETGCVCASQSCTCCADLNLQFSLANFHEEICLNVAYLAKSAAIQLAILVDGRAVFNMTVSAINPPPVCLPFIVGELCLEFYNLDISRNLFSGCALVDVLLLHQKVIHEKLGCFRIPVPIPSASANEK